MQLSIAHTGLGLLLLLHTASMSHGSPRVIGMQDAEGEPYKEAVRVLLRAIAKGDKEAWAAAFVGQGEDLKLLEATVASNAGMREFRDAVMSKLGDHGDGFKERFTFADHMLRSVDVQTIVVDTKRPDAASISPGGFPSHGYEVVLRDGNWKVLSITGFPKHIPAMLSAHSKLKDAFKHLTNRVNSGDFRTTDDALKAVGDTVAPIMQAFSEQTKNL